MPVLRRWFVALALLGTLVPAASASVAGAEDTGTAEDAARLIAEARVRANAAADAWSQAQSKLDLLADEKERIDLQVAELEKSEQALREVVEVVAVNRYIGAGSTGVALLSGNVGPTEQAQTALLVSLINEASASSFDDYNDLIARLEQRRDDADRTADDFEAAQRDFEDKQEQALAEIERLKLVEKDRLNDEAVQLALEAQRQKAVETQEQMAAELLRQDQEALAAAEGGGSDGGDQGLGVATGNIASAASAGGTTGGGGSGGRPNSGVWVIYGSGEAWVCPIPNGSAFADSWGAPRSGGRSHQGVDMIALSGTEIVAVVDGFAAPFSNTLGGTVLWLTGNDGNKYYYAHLGGYGNLGPVQKGQVIGYVGDSGNAIYSTPHLHFEIHPGGGAAVNPYQTVLANC